MRGTKQPTVESDHRPQYVIEGLPNDTFKTLEGAMLGASVLAMKQRRSFNIMQRGRVVRTVRF